MRQFITAIIILVTFISCGTQNKSIRNSDEKTPETVFTMIDSIQKKFDEIAERDSVNFKKNPKFVSSKSISNINHNAWNELLQQYVSEEGLVDYAGLKEDSQKLLFYLYDLRENPPTDYWTRKEKLAFWINAYNAMTIDLILESYPARKGIKNIRNPWKQSRWKIGETVYNLDTIEHEILRNMNEPRIHFAINCASFSCPPLLNEAFTAEKLEQQLTNVTKDFINDSKRNTITKDALEISKIFKWFTKDFTKNGSLIDFLNQYSTIKINQDADIDYKDYDWSLNEQ
ncbi:uncharacterized protein DUF547 [Kordia periserrulae]|uniref:Uncharacterized protein DUF547 n=1 Tax=Kordia periserrulae TaxID=701523 RepID=A0A2T6BT49_9FLAO|nr:DUF547 domain-containing protein [Kordia periserrulae]PTX59219.1 uncharacterized protein DUF547 [Kordia periserrulae]